MIERWENYAFRNYGLENWKTLLICRITQVMRFFRGY